MELEWLKQAGLLLASVGALAGVMKLVIMPLETNIRAIHGRLDRMDGRLEGVRKDLGALTERVTRVETLLEVGHPGPSP